jgi:DNA-binding CsgD family transcriptional regulator
MTLQAKARARRRISQLAGEGLDLVALWRACSEAMAPALPHYGAPCWFTLDPASLLATSHFQVGLPEIPREWLAEEYLGDDVNKMADVARSTRGVATLHEATGGDPSRSARFEREMVRYGVEQEMIAALRTPAGEVWGAVGLYREKSQPLFDGADVQFMRDIAPFLAEGARRALLMGEATSPDVPEAPGLLVLREDWSIESTTPGMERWITEFPDGDWGSGDLPSSVLAVAGQARRIAGGAHSSGELAVARVRTRAGRWIVLHGATLVSDSSPRVAVIVEPAQPARIASLLMAAYRLTAREAEVTRLVLQGFSSVQIAKALSISTHTVQQHLKAVFAKTDVHSRRDLLGRVFFSHYEPRLRDNEKRVQREQPVRGGPAPLVGR